MFENLMTKRIEYSGRGSKTKLVFSKSIFRNCSLGNVDLEKELTAEVKAENNWILRLRGLSVQHS
jgi:hypothetical protein